MSNFSICGIDCDSCKYKEESGCAGCRANKGQIFWGSCDLYRCCAEKGLEHCGHCDEFPCAMLREWASGENPERIENLRKLITQ